MSEKRARGNITHLSGLGSISEHRAKPHILECDFRT